MPAPPPAAMPVEGGGQPQERGTAERGTGKRGTGASAAATWPARARLVGLVLLLAAAYGVFWLARPVSQDAVRAWVEPLGPVAPLAFVAMAVLLGLALVPGPLLAGAAGLLFGAGLGTLITVVAATITAVLALLVARRVGRAGLDSFESRRAALISAALERHGLWAVIAQRLAPGVPDAPCSYAAGLLRVRVSQIALGTLIGSAPRAFGYTALGDSLDRPGSLLSLVGLGVVVLTSVLGAVVARRIFVQERRRRR